MTDYLKLQSLPVADEANEDVKSELITDPKFASSLSVGCSCGIVND